MRPCLNTALGQCCCKFIGIAKSSVTTVDCYPDFAILLKGLGGEIVIQRICTPIMFCLLIFLTRFLTFLGVKVFEIIIRINILILILILDLILVLGLILV